MTRRKPRPPARRTAPEPAARRMQDAVTSEMVFALDGAQSILHVSAFARRLTGKNAAGLLGRPFVHAVPDGDREAVSAWLAGLPSSGSATLVHRLTRSGGAVLWVETTARRQRVRALPAARICGACRDVTQHKLFELTVERVAQQWRATVDATNDAIFMLDADARVVRVNRPAARLCRLEFASILGRGIGELLTATLGLAVDLGVSDVLAGRGTQDLDLYLARGRRWLRAQTTALRDGDAATGAVLVLSDISARKSAEHRLQRSHEQLRRLSTHAEAATERSRAELAREIHDELGHLLTALKMDLAWIESKLAPADGALRERAHAAIAVSGEAIASVRRIAAELHPSVLDALGLAEAIAWHCRELQKRTGIVVDVAVPAAGPDLERSVATALFRILQEATTNVVRHAHAKSLSVELATTREFLRLRIADDGRGFVRRKLDTRRGFGLGLLGMQERGEMIGAEVTIRSRPRRGTTVTVRRKLTR